MSRMSTSAHTSPAAVPTWSLGWRLQRSLAYADMTTDDMARELEVSRGTVSRWINDKGPPPKRLYLHAWAARTGVDGDWLQGPDPQSPGPEPDQEVISGRRWSLGRPALAYA